MKSNIKSKHTICSVCEAKVVSEPMYTELGSFKCWSLPKHESGTCILYLLNKNKDLSKQLKDLQSLFGGR